MRIGILADIHGQISSLQQAVDCLQRENVDQVIALGDTIYDHQNIPETVAILRDVGAVCVWGNHELGLCVDPSQELLQRFDQDITSFFAGFEPQHEIDNILFSHTFPSQDACDPLSYYLGPQLTQKNALGECFAQFPHRRMIIGHFHRWYAATPSGQFEWNGSETTHLRCDERYFFVIHAVKDGHAAVFDQEQDLLKPIHF